MAIRLDPDQRQTAAEDARHDIPNHADPLEYPDAGATRRTLTASVAPLGMPASVARMYKTLQTIETRENALPAELFRKPGISLMREVKNRRPGP